MESLIADFVQFVIAIAKNLFLQGRSGTLFNNFTRSFDNS